MLKAHLLLEHSNKIQRGLVSPIRLHFLSVYDHVLAFLAVLDQLLKDTI